MAPGKLAGGLLGLMAGSDALGGPEEAQAAAIPNLRKNFLAEFWNLSPAKPMSPSGIPRADHTMHFMAGTLEGDAREQLSRIYPGVGDQLFIDEHPLVQRLRKGDWSYRKTLGRFEELLNDSNMRVVPNYSDNSRDAPYAILARGKRGDIYSPIFPTSDGRGFYAKTVYDPTRSQKRRALERRGGGRIPHLSSNGQAVADSQLLPLSDVAPSQSRNIAGNPPLSGNGGMPGIVPLGLLPGGPLSPSLDLRWDSPSAVQTTAPANTQRRGFSAVGSAPYPEQIVNARPAGVNNSISSNVLRQLGLGARAAMEGLGNSLSLGLADPGRVLADWVGLPAPVPGTPEAAVSGAVRGGADVMGWVVPGSGMARMASGPVARGVGQALSASPGAQVALGSGLGYAADRIGGLLGLLQEDGR